MCVLPWMCSENEIAWHIDECPSGPWPSWKCLGRKVGRHPGLNQLEIEKHSVGGIRCEEQAFSVLMKPLSAKYFEEKLNLLHFVCLHWQWWKEGSGNISQKGVDTLEWYNPVLLLPRDGASDLGLAVSVPLPIVTGIFVLLWFQSRLT